MDPVNFYQPYWEIDNMKNIWDNGCCLDMKWDLYENDSFSDGVGHTNLTFSNGSPTYSTGEETLLIYLNEFLNGDEDESLYRIAYTYEFRAKICADYTDATPPCNFDDSQNGFNKLNPYKLEVWYNCEPE